MALRGRIALLLCGGAVFSVLSAPAGRVEGRLLVKAKPGRSDAAVQALLAAHGAQEKSVIKQIGVRVVNVAPGNLDAALDVLKHHPDIEFAEPDQILPPDVLPNDPNYANQWHLPRIVN